MKNETSVVPQLNSESKRASPKQVTGKKEKENNEDIYLARNWALIASTNRLDYMLSSQTAAVVTGPATKRVVE